MTSQYKIYSKYKESGIDWIREIEKDIKEITAEIQELLKEEL
jgi:hypothetical protein